MQENERRFWGKIVISENCWEWQMSLTTSGYGQIRWDGVLKQVHRIMWELMIGKIPDGLCVLHECDNRKCVRPSHLFLGTQADNAHDRDAKGRGGEHLRRGARNGAHTHPESILRGEKNGTAKLTNVKIRLIRNRYAAGNVSQRALAKEFNVAQTIIGAVVRRETWKHIA